MDTLEQYDQAPSYSYLKDMLITFYFRKHAQHQAKQKAAARAGDKRQAGVFNVNPNQQEEAAKRQKTSEANNISTNQQQQNPYQPGRYSGTPGGRGKGRGGRGGRSPGGRGGRFGGRGNNSPGNQQTDMSQIQCYACGKYGHFAWQKDKCGANGQQNTNEQATSMQGHAVKFGQDDA